MYTYVHTNVHAHVRAFTHKYIYMCIHKHTQIHALICTFVHTHHTHEPEMASHRLSPPTSLCFPLFRLPLTLNLHFYSLKSIHPAASSLWNPPTLWIPAGVPLMHPITPGRFWESCGPLHWSVHSLLRSSLCTSPPVFHTELVSSGLQILVFIITFTKNLWHGRSSNTLLIKN